MKKLIIFVYAFLFLISLNAKSEEISIMGWVGLFDFQKPGWEKMVDEFEKSNPGVTINYIGTPFEDTLNQATVAMLGNNSPDIIQVVSGWVPQLEAAGGLEPINNHIDASTLNKFAEGAINAVSFDGNIMALPWIPGPIVMGYNRNLLEQAGLDPNNPPQTWDEFTEAVNKVCALGDDIYGVSLRSFRHPNSAHWSIPIIWANGGDLFDGDGNVSVNTPEVAKAYEWYRDTIKNGCSPDAFNVQETRALFGQGRAGFIFEGPWLRGLVNKLSEGNLKVGAQEDIWISSMPASSDGRVRQIANSNMLVLSKNSKNKEMAAKFIDFILGNPETVEYYYQTSQQPTTGRLDILQSGNMANDEYLQSFVDVLPFSSAIPIKSPQFNAMMDAVIPALQEIISGGDTSKALKNADRELKRIGF